jgi:hypothetical protein
VQLVGKHGSGVAEFLRQVRNRRAEPVEPGARDREPLGGKARRGGFARGRLRLGLRALLQLLLEPASHAGLAEKPQQLAHLRRRSGLGGLRARRRQGRPPR